MNSLAFPPTEVRTLPREAFVALACSVALAACTHEGTVAWAPDASPDAPVSQMVIPDASAPVDTAGCSLYPLTSRWGSTGPAWYWWYFHWDAIGDVRGFCASYGDGAKMVIEVVDPRNPAPSTALPTCASDEILRGGTRACAVPDSYQFEVDCTAGGLLFELPSDRAFTGYYHVESAQVPEAARHPILQDLNCVRDVYIAGSPEHGSIDAGTSDGPTVDAGGPGSAEAGGNIPSGGSCGSIVTHCAATSCEGRCSMGALAETTKPIMRACGADCGFLHVGFSGGCATVVEGTSKLGDVSFGSGEGMACVKRYLFSHRFDCAPADGWKYLNVGDCPLP